MNLPALAVATVVVLELLSLRALAIDLAEPPSGFTWRAIPEIRGAVLVPNGWHVRTERDGKTVGIFVTESKFSPSQKYETGLSINAFLDDSNAPQKLQKILDHVAAQYSAKLVPGWVGLFATRTSEYEIPRDGGREPLRVYSLGIANSRTSTTYLVMFESPRNRWSDTWSKGKVIVNTLALDDEL